MFPVSVQSRDDVGLVLILVTADYHQTVVCGGGRGKEVSERGRSKEEEEEGGVRKSGGYEAEREEVLFKASRWGKRKKKKKR